VVIVLAILIANLRRSVTGRQMLAVRTNERAAAGAGISVARAKLLAFALSSFIAGLAGALSAYRFGSVSAATFGSFTSIAFLAFAYLGGISSVTGAVVGGMLVAGGIGFTALHQWTGIDPGLTNLLGGLGLILTAILNPEGMAGGFNQIGRLAASLAGHRSVAPAQLPVALRTDEGVVI
jgi:branched-chain amino acid transport system permease protein